MTRTEAAARPSLGPDAKVCVIAGGGKLPVELSRALAEHGLDPFLVLVEGEFDTKAGLDRYEHVPLALEEIGSLAAILKRHRVTHLVLAGEIRRRPRLAAMRLNFGLLRIIPLLLVALARGDDGLLRVFVRAIEARSIKVVGAHEIVPDLVATEGLFGQVAPQKSDWKDIDAARIAAEMIGALDIGQGAVAIGGRAIALEGIEGTDGMLERVRDLRGHGRIAGRARGVLVKCAKPGQEMRADLPSIGPRTVEEAHAAGLAGIAVEAGCSLVLDGPGMVKRADALGLFVLGLPPKDGAHGA